MPNTHEVHIRIKRDDVMTAAEMVLNELPRPCTQAAICQQVAELYGVEAKRVAAPVSAVIFALERSGEVKRGNRQGRTFIIIPKRFFPVKKQEA